MIAPLLKSISSDVNTNEQDTMQAVFNNMVHYVDPFLKHQAKQQIVDIFEVSIEEAIKMA